MKQAFLLWGVLCFGGSAFAAEPEPPSDWIEPQTGHRVVRLSREPGSASLYFHQYPYSADGKKLIITTPGGISAVNLETRRIEPVVAGRVQVLVTGRKTGDVYYIRGDHVMATNLDTHEARRVVKLPDSRRARGNVTVNADETLIVGVGTDPDGEAQPRTPPESHRADRLTERWSSGRPMRMYTIDVASGNLNVIHRSHDWLNHLQCSPTDPGQIMFCHEGPWHFVERVWLIRTDGSGLTSVQPRTMDMEIAGHEFFSNDGTRVWYDLQTPRSLVFWLAGYDIADKSRIWYHLDRKEWSVHFNISPDGKLFAGDGGGPRSVANLSPSFEPLDPPGNGQWIYLFRPEMLKRSGLPEAAKKQVKVGVLRAERLVDLSKHDYTLEPNVTFTPDGKWIVFRSNMHGPTHVYAVEVDRTGL
jgi:oligogalacturonide lyase